MEAHLDHLSREYQGNVQLINLINGKKSEGRLEQAFRQAMDNLDAQKFRCVKQSSSLVFRAILMANCRPHSHLQIRVFRLPQRVQEHAMA